MIWSILSMNHMLAGKPLLQSWVSERYFQRLSFQKGEAIFLLGAVSNACYFLENGLARLELHSESASSGSEPFLYLGEGELLGEMAFFDGLPRSASAFAETDVQVLVLTKSEFERLSLEYPTVALELFAVLMQELSVKLRATTSRLDNLLSYKQDAEIEKMIDYAASAQHVLMSLSVEKLDTLLLRLVEVFEYEADSLAEMVVQETGIGNAVDKAVKHRMASRAVYESFRNEKLYGILSFDEEKQIIELGEPIGIILGFIPVTNPVSTFIFKVLSAIKSRNALILIPNRQALRSCERVGELLRSVLLELSLPTEIVQWEGLASRKRALTLMRHKRIGLVLATGGPELVRAAYSSGNPAIGVGSGNSPTLIAPDADLLSAAQMIVESKSFDNGLICGSEHNLIVHARVFAEFTAGLEAAGAAVLRADEIRRLQEFIAKKPGRILPERILGQAASSIAELLFIERPYPIRLLVVPIEAISDDWLCREKLAPITSLLSVGSMDEAFGFAKELLALDGQGHTAVIHTQDEALARDFALQMPVSRILLNSAAVLGIFGLTTGLEPSLVLACGSHGNALTTENITARNLINRKRMALPLSDSALERPVDFEKFVLEKSE
jgi:acetaldehyde dehydrogenase/alcohol dehydrogenase